MTAETVNRVIREQFGGDPIGRYQEIQRALCAEENVSQLTAADRKVVTSCIHGWRVHAASLSRKRALEGNKERSFTIVMAYSEDYPVGKVCEAVNRRYAEKHGYEFVVHCKPAGDLLEAIRPKAHCTWYKVKMVNEMLEASRGKRSVHYVVWIDADAVVVDMELRLENIVGVADGFEVIIGEDMSACSLVNAGVFMVRSCGFSRGLFKELWESKVLAKYDSQRFYEQSALIWLLKRRREGFETVDPFHYHRGGPLVKKFPHVCVLAKHIFNSNVCERGDPRDPPAQFVFHPAGAKAKLAVIQRALEIYGIGTVDIVQDT